MACKRVCLLGIFFIFSLGWAHAQENLLAPYEWGNPSLQTVYVMVSGDDGNDGLSPQSALRTLASAWERIPMGQDLTIGYHILMGTGTYLPEETPNYWESRYGTAQFPIVIEAMDGQNTVYLPSVNIFDAKYLYFVNLNFEVGSDAFHCEQCDHLLLRGNRFVGDDPDTYNAQETVKVNQSQYVYLEDNDISGAWDNAIDFVAVQYGHWLNNRVHNAGDWCAYLKGGSAYFVVAYNEFYDCGTGGITAGQGTGYQFMTAPFFQYEAYDLKIINNLIHDTSGAGVGVQGGYNILVAYNLMVRVGERSHGLEFGFGSRSCDGQPSDSGRENCEAYSQQGGWGNTLGADGENFTRIPNKNVYVYNNILYNPAPFQSAYQHFFIPAPYSGEFNANTAIPSVSADDNLQIVNNLIWNGGADLPLGIEADAGCASENPTCNASQWVTQNQINTLEPQLVNMAGGDYSLVTPFSAVAIPDFGWDVPIPQGTLSNQFAPTFKTDGTVFDSFATVGTLVAEQPTTTPDTNPIVATDVPMTVPHTVGQPLPVGAITLVTLGDSLTEGAEDNLELGGYPSRLLAMLQALRPGTTLLNVGHSGWNSDALINGDQGLPSELSQALEVIQQASANEQPSLALVWIGSNDLFYLYEYNDPDAMAEQADLENYGRNLDTILSQLTNAGARVVIALLDDQSMRPVVTRGEAFPGTSAAEVVAMSEQVKRYNTLIAEKATQYGALLVDFYQTDIFTNPATLADDGNHPNANGYDVVAGMWFATLQALLP